MESGRVDLEQLKQRLAKLGVHIQEPAEPSCEEGAPLVESNVRRHNKTLAQLLGRCARVQHALDDADVDGSVDGSDEDKAAHKQAAKPALEPHSKQQGTSKHHDVCSNSAAGRLRAAAGRPGSGASAADSSKHTAAAGRSQPPAAAEVDRQLLVRAAQQLLEDAQEDAQQVSRDLKAAGAAPARRAASAAAGTRAAAAAGGSSAPARRQAMSAAAAAAAGASVDDLRNSPLGTVLAQYKEAQAAWAQEKAKLRREAVSARKEASQARLELAKVSRSSEHRAQEASCLKAALKGRDVLLEEMQGRVRQLEDELARCQEIAAERLVSVSRERDDLQALLLATLERLEGVEAVVAAADATSAAMEEKVRVLEAERLAALQTAATARQEVFELQEARRRLELQSQLLEKMSKVQLQHNKRKSEALRELLASTEAVEAAAAAECDSSGPRGDGHNGGSSRHAHDSCSRATAALQDLLDELLANSNE